MLRAVYDGGAVVSEVQDIVHEEFGALPADLKMNELRPRLVELGIEAPGGTAKQPWVDAAHEWLATRPEGEFRQAWRALTSLERERLPRFVRFSSSEAFDPAGQLRSLVQTELYRLLREANYAPLGEVADQLRAGVAGRLEGLRAKILEYCPDFSEVTVRAEPDFSRPAITIEFFVHRGGEQIDFSREGQGVRRRCTLAIHESELEVLRATDTGPTAVIAYDEPDTHLDYRGQRELFEIIQQQADLSHVQVVVATHSRNFIDRAPLPSLRHFVLEDRRTRIETLGADTPTAELELLASVSAGLGLRNSVLLDEGCFLVVEGETEETAAHTLYRVATQTSLVASGVTVINTKGSGAVRGVVEQLMCGWDRDVVVIVDEDARGDLSDGWLARFGLTEGENLFFVGTAEFEDAFTDGQWARALNTHHPKPDGRAWTADEVTSLRSEEKFSKALANTVKREVRDASVGKPELGLAIASTLENPESIPAPVLAALRALRQLARRP